MSGHDPKAVANYFILRAAKYRQCKNRKSRDENWKSSYFLYVLQLHKMVFAAYGYNLALNGTRLCNEVPEYFDLKLMKGVFFPSLHRALALYGNSAVIDFIYSDDPYDNKEGEHSQDELITSKFSTNELEVLDGIWAAQIETNMTCSDWSNYTIHFQKVGKISDEEILAVFKQKIAKYAHAA